MQHINVKILPSFVAMAFVLRINTNCYTAIPLLSASDGFLVDDSLPKKLFLYQGVVQVRTRVSDIAVPVVVGCVFKGVGVCVRVCTRLLV